MSIRLRFRIILGFFWILLLAVATGSALEVQQINNGLSELRSKDLALVRCTTEMLLAIHEPLPTGWTAPFEAALSTAEAVAPSSTDMELVRAVRIRFDQIVQASAPTTFDANDLRRNLTTLLMRSSSQASEGIAEIESETTLVVLCLAVLSGTFLLSGMWPLASMRVHLFDPLAEIENVVQAASENDKLRRVTDLSIGEFGRLGDALNGLLDDRDRLENELRGRIRDGRAMLTALLRRWRAPAAIAGIDGEVIVSTLSYDQEQILTDMAPRVRSAARTLLSRGFTAAENLTADFNLPNGIGMHIQSLALGEKRIVGWLATFQSAKDPREGES